MDPVAELQNETRRILGSVLRAGEPVAFLDFPLYHNPGDSLIFLGTLNYLQQLAVPVRYIADDYRYRPEMLRRFHPEGPIVLQGGGNFGDRWRRLQSFRERVIRDFPDRRIVQLPQGIDFTTAAGLATAQDVFAQHPNLTILIRDTVGLEKARQAFPSTEVEYCPDLAVGYGYIHKQGPEEHEYVELKRQDSESRLPDLTSRSDLVDTRTRRDWGLSRVEKLRWNMLRVPLALFKRLPADALYPTVHRNYRRLAELQVGSARRILGHGRVVVTDRLHAAVLAALMRKPVVVLDNANGKIRAMDEDYLHSLNGWFFAESPEDARSTLAGILN
jgi:exopolysaccharide biosynthesis predicted pyruvyltransferase EpsI